MPAIRSLTTFVVAFLAAALVALSAHAGSVAPRDGWAVHDTGLAYAELLQSLKKAVEAEGMFVVTEAGPTEAARSRGVEIAGNRVVGVFRNDFAVRAVRASTAAMLEAPIRFYVTGDADGTATLSYKRPGFVFAPYLEEGGKELRAVAEELDAIFAAIAARAVAE